MVTSIASSLVSSSPQSSEGSPAPGETVRMEEGGGSSHSPSPAPSLLSAGRISWPKCLYLPFRIRSRFHLPPIFHSCTFTVLLLLLPLASFTVVPAVSCSSSCLLPLSQLYLQGPAPPLASCLFHSCTCRVLLLLLPAGLPGHGSPAGRAAGGAEARVDGSHHTGGQALLLQVSASSVRSVICVICFVFYVCLVHVSCVMNSFL